MQKAEGRRQKVVGHGRAVPNPRSKYSVVWLAGLVLALVVAGCASRGSSTTSLPGRGALSLEVVPNPIIANRVSGDTYDFPFEAVIRETGGAEVRIERVRFEVSAFGGFPLYSETFGPDEIARRGFPQIVPANGELRYQFSPRKSADDRLFGSVSASLRIDGVDTSGAPTSARTRVTVRRR